MIHSLRYLIISVSISYPTLDHYVFSGSLIIILILLLHSEYLSKDCTNLDMMATPLLQDCIYSIRPVSTNNELSIRFIEVVRRNLQIKL